MRRYAFRYWTAYGIYVYRTYSVEDAVAMRRALERLDFSYIEAT